MAVKLALFIVVTAANMDYREVPVSVVVPKQLGGGVPLLTNVETRELVPSQCTREGDETRLWWIERDLKKGQKRKYSLSFAMGREVQPQDEVAVKEGDESVEVKIRGELFTKYVFTGSHKPYCYPVIGPTGEPVTRNYPMKDVDGESKDHPHHRSAFWWTHGEVNGQDFWAEGDNASKTVHRRFKSLSGGPVLGVINAINDWVSKDGPRILTDNRELRIYNTTGGQLVDFDITLTATAPEVVFGDTKEGCFGFRVAHTMKLDKGGKGHIENAQGDKDKPTWGKASPWCDYYGPVPADGKTVGIAIMDSPTSFRHPTYWHVRTYGLFAANPFGLRHFIGDKEGKGKLALREGESVTFRYRVWIHEGTTQEANVAQAFAEYADPPKVAWIEDDGK